MNCECLEQLRTVANSLGMLDNDSHHPAACAVGDLDPVARDGRLRGEVDRDGGDGVGVGVAVQLGHEEVVVLHAEGELLHVDVVDGAVRRAQEEEGAGGVVRRYRG